jgi:hypothetical protein
VPQPARTKAREALSSRPANSLSNACRDRQNLHSAARAGLMGKLTVRGDRTHGDAEPLLFALRSTLRLFNDGVSTARINKMVQNFNLKTCNILPTSGYGVDRDLEGNISVLPEGHAAV